MTQMVLSKAESDPRVKSRDIQTYVHLYYHPLMTVSEIARNTGRSRETVRSSVSRLVEAGWAYIHVEPGRRIPGIVVPWMPLEVEHQLAALIAQRRNLVPFLGEFLMRCLLDLCVKDSNYYDDAFPPFLITPQGQRLQLDRWYWVANVAFEFQGQQHFEQDGKFVRTSSDLSRRLAYDGEKLRLCTLNGVRLFELRASDLDYHRLREKLSGKLPLIPIRENRPLFREVAGMCSQYRSFVEKE